MMPAMTNAANYDRPGWLDWERVRDVLIYNPARD
jgi:hypothetical protein